MKLLQMNHVKKSFNDETLHVLKDISLSVEKGEVVAIIGPSGSGKSTLLRCATLLTEMDSGELIYGDIQAVHNDADGKAVYADKGELKKVREKFGLVFQSFNLFPHYSVMKNIIDAPIHVQKKSKQEAVAKAKELLEKSQLPCLNYGTHTPMLLDKGCLAAMFERFPELEEGGYLFTSVYYNSLPYPTQPVYLNWPTDQVLLPVVSQKPDEKKVLDLLSRKMFMNNAVSGYSPWLEKFLEGVFSEPSDFEG